MNTESNFDDKSQQREWDAQERAVREERSAAIVTDDARVMQYRFIAHALRHGAIAPLPSDFAYRTAMYVERLAEALNDRVERILQRVLFALLAAAGLGAAVLFGDEWLTAFTAPLQIPAELRSSALTSWSLVGAACVGLSWAIEHWQRRVDDRQ